jgi:hypothetical protein
MFELEDTAFINYTTAFWLDKMRHSYQANDTRLAILLGVIEHAQYSDVRDKIYGLVGLANDAADVVIDYSKSPLDLFVDPVLRGRKNDKIRDDLISSAHYWQRLLLGEVETPPIDSLYS